MIVRKRVRGSLQSDLASVAIIAVLHDITALGCVNNKKGSGGEGHSEGSRSANKARRPFGRGPGAIELFVSPRHGRPVMISARHWAARRYSILTCRIAPSAVPLGRPSGRGVITLNACHSKMATMHAGRLPDGHRPACWRYGHGSGLGRLE
jgi:hypothetical protein